MKLILANSYYSDDIKQILDEMQIPMMDRSHFFNTISEQAHKYASIRFKDYSEIDYPRQVYFFDASHILENSDALCQFRPTNNQFIAELVVSIVTRDELNAFKKKHAIEGDYGS